MKSAKCWRVIGRHRSLKSYQAIFAANSAVRKAKASRDSANIIGAPVRGAGRHSNYLARNEVMSPRQFRLRRAVFAVALFVLRLARRLILRNNYASENKLYQCIIHRDR